MPQRFLCALAFTLTLATNLNPMTRDDDHHDGSKLTLPRFDPKDPTYFDNLQAYAQDHGLVWLLLFCDMLRATARSCAHTKMH